MKTRLLTLVTLLLAIVMPAKLWAQEPYVVLTANPATSSSSAIGASDEVGESQADTTYTLTFYYDDQKEQRGGMSIGSPQSWQSEREKITTAVFDPSFAKYNSWYSTHEWFYNFRQLTEIRGIENLNTEYVDDMGSMFSGCSGLTSLNVSNFNTANVWSMAHMFEGCSSLKSLDVSNFNNANVEDMYGMFEGCSSLKSLNLNGFNTSNVDIMGNMFSGCSSLTSLDLSGFNTTNVTDMGGMFSGCSGLTSLDLSGFNTENVTDMGDMFYDCSGLKSLDLSGFNTTNLIGMGWMFRGCSGLTSLDLSGFNTENVTSLFSMFSDCSGLTSLDLSTFNTKNVTDMIYMFSGCSNLTTIYVSSLWTTDNLSVPAHAEHSMFSECYNLVGGQGTAYDDNHLDETYAHIDGGPSNPGYFTDKNAPAVIEPEPYAVLTANAATGSSSTIGESEEVGESETDTTYTLTFYYDDQKAARNGMSVGPFGHSGDQTWYDQRESITTVVFDQSFANCTSITSTARWFFDLENLTSINGIEYLNTANVTDMSKMFSQCYSLTSLALSGFDTRNVTDMSSMFAWCNKLEYVDVSHFQTDKVTDMSIMFGECPALTSLDVSGFNTANVTNMRGMFINCKSLKSLDVANFNTENATDIAHMFDGCSSLTSLDVSNFNTANVTDLQYLFNECSNLSSLDVTSFNTANVTDMMFMFYGCSSLTTIYAGNEWTTANLTDGNGWGMFTSCTSLIGGQGTVYDWNYTDQTYAHIDGGPDNPGYFTDKNAPVIEGIAEFDGIVATVSGERRLDEAFESAGGRAEAAKTIAAIVWDKETALTQSDLQGLDNPNLLIYVNDASQVASLERDNVVVNGVAKNIVLIDYILDENGYPMNNNFYAPQEFTAEMVSYSRYFEQSTQVGVSRGWESIALPFTVQTVTHEKQGVIAPFGSSQSDKHFWLRRLGGSGLTSAERIEANVPYIISMPNSTEYSEQYNLNGRVTFSAENAVVPATEVKALALADSSITMVPAMQRVDRSSEVWALNVGAVRGQYLEGSVFERDYREVRPFEAYTVHGSASSNADNPSPRMIPIRTLMSQETTGIEEVSGQQAGDASGAWYTIDGRRLQGKPTKKGVYIRNGKKQIVK